MSGKIDNRIESIREQFVNNELDGKKGSDFVNKVNKLKSIKNKLDTLEQEPCAEQFCEVFINLKTKLKDTNSVNFLENEVNRLKEQIFDYQMREKKEGLLERVRNLSDKCKEIDNKDIENFIDKSFINRKHTLLNDAYNKVCDGEKFVDRFLNVEKDFQDLELKCNEVSITDIADLIDTTSKNKDGESLDNAYNKISERLKFIDWVVTLKNQIHHWENENPDFYRILSEKLNEAAKSLNKRGLSAVNRLNKEYESILKFSEDLQMNLAKLVKGDMLTNLDTSEIENLIKKGKEIPDKKQLDDAKERIEFIEKSKILIKNIHTDIIRLDSKYEKDETWQNLRKLYNDFRKDWKKEKLEEIRFLIKEFSNKEDIFLNYYNDLESKIKELEIKNDRINAEQKIRLDEEKNLLRTAKQTYDAGKLKTVEDSLVFTEKEFDRYCILRNNLEEQQKHINQLIDQYSAEKMTEKIYRIAKDKLESKKIGIQNQFDECEKILYGDRN